LQSGDADKRGTCTWAVSSDTHHFHHLLLKTGFGHHTAFRLMPAWLGRMPPLEPLPLPALNMEIAADRLAA
jgi:hypothetical protein